MSDGCRGAVQSTVIESMDAHGDPATQCLSLERVSRSVARVLIAALRRVMRLVQSAL